MAVRSLREFPYNEGYLDDISHKSDIVVNAMLRDNCNLNRVVVVVQYIIEHKGVNLPSALTKIIDSEVGQNNRITNHLGAALVQLQYEVGTLSLVNISKILRVDLIPAMVSANEVTENEARNIGRNIAWNLIRDDQTNLGVIGFYSHTKEYSEFSNFYPADFVVKGNTFHWSEQYLMWLKAVTFGDLESAEKILKVDNPRSAKAIGRKVTPFDPVVWDSKVRDMAYQIVMAKFSQNEELKTLLLSTGNKILAEAAPRDTNWGVGKGNTPDIQDKALWRGTNVLGEALMRVRRDLRNNQQ